jgi:hypothetical protein
MDFNQILLNSFLSLNFKKITITTALMISVLFAMMDMNKVNNALSLIVITFIIENALSHG